MSVRYGGAGTGSTGFQEVRATRTAVCRTHTYTAKVSPDRTRTLRTGLGLQTLCFSWLHFNCTSKEHGSQLLSPGIGRCRRKAPAWGSRWPVKSAWGCVGPAHTHAQGITTAERINTQKCEPVWSRGTKSSSQLSSGQLISEQERILGSPLLMQIPSV